MIYHKSICFFITFCCSYLICIVIWRTDAVLMIMICNKYVSMLKQKLFCFHFLIIINCLKDNFKKKYLKYNHGPVCLIISLMEVEEEKEFASKWKSSSWQTHIVGCSYSLHLYWKQILLLPTCWISFFIFHNYH